MFVSMTALFKFIHNQPNFEKYTFILPCVSVGNVPQLTVDLLINSYDFKKCAYVWHSGIVPLVGGDPYGSDQNGLYTACELYTNDTLKVAVLQLRSTIHFKFVKKFLNDLTEALLELKFSSVFIISSAFDYELHIVKGDKFFYSSNDETIETTAKTADVQPLVMGPNGKYAVHGSGFTIPCFDVLKQRFKCTLLCKFVSEGDNRPDAIKTLEKLKAFIPTISSESVNHKFPSSWAYVFGKPPPLGLY